MKTRKLLSLLAVAVMSFSTLAVTTNAEKVNENPVASVDVAAVKSGKAALDIYFNIDAELEAYKAEENDDWDTVYTGKALQQLEVAFTVNSDLFKTDTVKLSDSHTFVNPSAQATVKSDKTVTFVFLPTANAGWLAQNSFKLCRVQVELSDASMTLEQLKAMTNIVDFSVFNVTVSAYPEGGAINNATGYVQTGYRLDGNGDFLPSVIEGAEKQPEPPAPTASVDVTGAFQTTDADWVAANGKTIYWGVDFANGGFNGTAVAKIFNEAGDERILNIVQDGEINGDASFGVFAILGDKTDALKLTVTSGDVTDTADAFVAAE